MKGELEITTLTLEGQTVFSKKVSFDLGANGCEDVASITTTELYGGKKENEVFIYVTLNEMVKQFLRTSIIRSTPISILIQRWLLL